MSSFIAIKASTIFWNNGKNSKAYPKIIEVHVVQWLSP